MTARYGTRPEKTHVAGFSNGGHFTLLLAERAKAFATFTVIGSVQPGFRSDAPPKPVLYGHMWPSQGNAWLREFTQHAWPTVRT